jgi:branched-chain amino acid transport system permease protein
MYRIDPVADLRLAREFRTTPIGRHSPDLQRLLRFFRGEPVEGKYALLCTVPNREWRLVELSGEVGKPLTVHQGRVYTSLAEAEWDVFKLRWKRYTGQDLVLDEEGRR